MANFARIFVLVQDPEHRIIDDAFVEGKSESEENYREIPYNTQFQRHLLDKHEAGPFQVRVKRSDRDTTEIREIKLVNGDNHIHVMLGKPGMLSFKTAGMNYYFEPREEELLLSVRGAKNTSQITESLEKENLKYEILPDANGKIRSDDLLMIISIGKDEEAIEARRRLELLIEGDFPKQRINGKLAAPIYKENQIALGITNEIIVRFKSSFTVDQIEEFSKKYNLELKRHLPYISNGVLFILKGTPEYKILDLFKEIEKNNDVIYAQPNLFQRLQNSQYVPNDFSFQEVPHLQVINCDDAWQALGNLPAGNVGGSPDTTIAVLDLDGVDPLHPDLTGQLSDGTQKMIASWDFVNMNNQTQANLPGNHGTKCAGSATARMDNTIGITGIAPNCHLIGGRFPNWATDIDIADIWVWMAGFPYSPNPNNPAQLANGAEIISNSWAPIVATATNDVLRDVFDFLTTHGRGGRGCILCFSLGNYGYILIDNFNPFSADEKTLGIGASINIDPTNPCDSFHADHNGWNNNRPAILDTRSYYSPYGMTVDLVSPSHTCYDFGTGEKIDPILSCSVQDNGDWPANAVVQTTTTQAVVQGSTVINVVNSTGFQVGEFILFNIPGIDPIETKEITGVAPNQITIFALDDAYPIGTIVSSGPNDYIYDFGGTSHSCPTVAGAAALLLSVLPDLTWIEVRRILRNSAAQIDQAQANATGQWIDLDGDGVDEFSQWYGYGRLNVEDAVNAVINLNQRADIVIRDNFNDTGIVPSQGWHALSPDIWVRQADDPIPNIAYDSAPPFQNPLYGQDNYLYLRVKNFGNAVAPIIYVRGLITHFPGIEFQYPEDWQPTPNFGEDPALPLVPGTYLIGEEQITDLAPNDDIIVKMTWEQDLIPPEEVTLDGGWRIVVKWHPCILAEVSPHDGPAPVADAYPVKGNNNLAHLNISIEYPDVGGASFFAAAAVAGTHHIKGIKSIIIDRSKLPKDYELLIHTLNKEHLNTWIELLKQKKGFKSFNPLGEVQRIQIKGTKMKGINISLINKGVELSEFYKQKALSIGASISTVALPLRLKEKEYIPIIIGITRPKAEEPTIKGSVRISQVRGDGEISPGYEILC